MKRVALLTATLFGAMLAFQPAIASAQDRYDGYRHNDRAYSYRHDYDRHRDWRRDERRDREWREHEWRDRQPAYYRGSAYFYDGAPASSYGYGYGYAPGYNYAPPCR